MAWILLIVGGVFEVGWAVGLKYTEGFTRLWPSVWTAAAMVVSFAFFAKAMMRIEAGTAYAVFTGLGTAGTVIVGIVLLDEPVSLLRLVFVLVLVGGIIGLKMTATDPLPDESPDKSAHMLPQGGGRR